jgi:hypothetical protein
MSIEVGSIYESITFLQDNNILWTIYGPFSGDFIAGVVTAFNVVVNDPLINKNFEGNQKKLDIVSEGGKGLISIEFNKSLQGSYSSRDPFGPDTQIFRILNDYILINNIFMEEFSDYQPNSNYFGWWIINPIFREKYTLFYFSSSDFIQGFITILNSFNVDFRDYIAGPPFTYVPKTKQIILYNIEGYDIEPIPQSKKPAPIGAFYTGVYEADPNAEDFE